MPKLTKSSDNAWRIIDTPEEISKIFDMLTNYQLWNPSDKAAILRYGYKNLSSGDKETYYVLKDLTLLSAQGKSNAFCKVSAEYLAIVLGTSEKSQRRRIDNLESTKLITTTISKRYSANLYYVNLEPLPDTTFVETIEKLIMRKKLYALINTMRHSNNAAEKLECALKIKEIDPSGAFTSRSIPQLLDDIDISAMDILDTVFEEQHIFTH